MFGVCVAIISCDPSCLLKAMRRARLQPQRRSKLVVTNLDLSYYAICLQEAVMATLWHPVVVFMQPTPYDDVDGSSCRSMSN